MTACKPPHGDWPAKLTLAVSLCPRGVLLEIAGRSRPNSVGKQDLLDVFVHKVSSIVACSIVQEIAPNWMRSFRTARYMASEGVDPAKILCVQVLDIN